MNTSSNTICNGLIYRSLERARNYEAWGRFAITKGRDSILRTENMLSGHQGNRYIIINASRAAWRFLISSLSLFVFPVFEYSYYYHYYFYFYYYYYLFPLSCARAYSSWLFLTVDSVFLFCGNISEAVKVLNNAPDFLARPINTVGQTARPFVTSSPAERCRLRPPQPVNSRC